VTDHEAEKIAKEINEVFNENLSKYNFSKYPADAYERYKAEYASLNPKKSNNS